MKLMPLHLHQDASAVNCRGNWNCRQLTAERYYNFLYVCFSLLISVNNNFHEKSWEHRPSSPRYTNRLCFKNCSSQHQFCSKTPKNTKIPSDDISRYFGSELMARRAIVFLFITQCSQAPRPKNIQGQGVHAYKTTTSQTSRSGFKTWRAWAVARALA